MRLRVVGIALDSSLLALSIHLILVLSQGLLYPLFCTEDLRPSKTKEHAQRPTAHSDRQNWAGLGSGSLTLTSML